MQVKNINSSSMNTCSCGSWIDHWKKFSNRTLKTYCPAKNCVGKELVGALVQKADSNDTNWYVIPLCKHHTINTKKSVEVFNGVKFVSANLKETCG